jgi:hypothetical protein
MSSVSGLRAYAKHCGYTHFEKSDGPFLLFYSMDECEVCGCELQAANSIKVVGKVENAKRAGLTEMRAPDEGGHCEALGLSTCPGCYVEEAECTAAELNANTQ